MSDNWDLSIADSPAGYGVGEDRWFFWESSDGVAWASVIDGASSELEDRPNGGDYADALRQGLFDAVSERPSIGPTEALERGISTAARALRLPKPSAPSAAVGLVRWDRSSGPSAAVLGDVSVVFISGESEEVLHDTRLGGVAADERQAYRAALAAGRGYDAGHRETIRRIRRVERALRNSHHGYWIAAEEPAAAEHALTLGAAGGVDAVVITSDGAAAAVTRYHLVDNWRNFARVVQAHADHIPMQIRALEISDLRGERWPRSKPNDDVTALVLSPA